jgi:hypothetical protein
MAAWFFGMWLDYRFFDHRLLAAADAISLRRSADSDAARAFPPFNPPRRPRATANGFLPSAVLITLPFVAISTIADASELTSVGILERFGISERYDWWERLSILDFSALPGGDKRRHRRAR